MATPKTYLITGANQGIGLEFARQLRERGEVVYGSFRKDAGPLADMGCELIGDIEQTDNACLDKMAQAAAPVDVLILNAAILPKEGADKVHNKPVAYSYAFIWLHRRIQSLGMSVIPITDSECSGLVLFCSVLSRSPQGSTKTS